MSDETAPPGETNPDHREAGREVKDFAKALRHGWPISDEYRDASVKACMRILLSSKSERNRLNAIKALGLLGKQNIDAEKLELQKRKADFNAELPDDSGPVTVEIQYDDDYFGTAAAAARRVANASSDGSPIADPDEPGAAEDPGVRS